MHGIHQRLRAREPDASPERVREVLSRYGFRDVDGRLPLPRIRLGETDGKPPAAKGARGEGRSNRARVDDRVSRVDPGVDTRNHEIGTRPGDYFTCILFTFRGAFYAMVQSLGAIPVFLDLARDMEELCPDALLLNYVNPMAMNMMAILQGTGIRSVGLCHSVQGTSRMLARHLDVPYEEERFKVAGINHQAWFTRLELSDVNLDVATAIDRPPVEIDHRSLDQMLLAYSSQNDRYRSR